MKETWVRSLSWEDSLLPGEYHGQRSLVGYSQWGHKKSDMTERLALLLFMFFIIYSSNIIYNKLFSSCLVMSDSLRPHRLQHARLPCPSSSPGAHSNLYPQYRINTHISFRIILNLKMILLYQSQLSTNLSWCTPKAVQSGTIRKLCQKRFSTLWARNCPNHMKSFVFILPTEAMWNP